jgi:hypothetical protein
LNTLGFFKSNNTFSYIQKPFLLWILFLLPAAVFAQQKTEDQDTAQQVVVSGKVVSQQDLEPLSYVHVMVLNSNKGAVTDEEGRFELVANESDTLLFSRVGFEKVALNLLETPEKSLQFMLVVMPTRPVTLREVVIYANHPLLRYKGQPIKVPGVDSYDGPRIEPPAVTSKIGPRFDNSGGVPVAGMGITYEGVITALAAQFSKKEKEKKKYLELIEKDAERKAYEMIRNRKINVPLVKRVLDVDEEQAQSFMEHFNPSKQFVLGASEYDMILAIMNSYKEFERIRKAIEPQDD